MGHGREVNENTLDAFVRLLRKKVDQNFATKLIQTHRGFGYSVGPRKPAVTLTIRARLTALYSLVLAGFVRRLFLDMRFWFSAQHRNHR